MSETTPEMQTNHPVRTSSCGRGLFGPLILIALGVIFLLDQLNIMPAGHVFNYFWPAVFIIFGIEMLSSRPVGPRAFWGVVAIAVGGVLIANNLGYWAFDLSQWWPLILIAAGVSLLFRRPWARPYPRRYYGRRGRAQWMGHEENTGTSGAASRGAVVDAAAEDSENYVDGMAVFGGFQRRITSQQFTGGRVTALFGGVQLDLHRAEIAGERATLDVTATFGGVEVRVPEHWIIEMRGQPFLGGFSDETHQDKPLADARRLRITGWAMFGGVVVKN